MQLFPFCHGVKFTHVARQTCAKSGSFLYNFGQFCRFYGTWLQGCFQQDLTFLLQVSSRVGTLARQRGHSPASMQAPGDYTLIQDREQLPWVLTVLQFCNVLHVKNCGEHLLAWCEELLLQHKKHAKAIFGAKNLSSAGKQRGEVQWEGGVVGLVTLPEFCRTSFSRDPMYLLLPAAPQWTIGLVKRRIPGPWKLSLS